ncbi:MAG: methionyl-tRNA formyltransferase [Patescibacteria group bacterium]
MNHQKIPKKWRVLFAGTPSYAIPSLAALLGLPNIEVVGVLTQKSKPAGRGQVPKSSPIEVYAKEKDLFILSPDSLKDNDILALLNSFKADCAIVIAYGKIIPENLLNLLPYGWLNLHASLLPRWRGASPIQYAITSGDKKTGVTLMKIDKGMDTGPILISEELPILKTETSLSLAKKLSDLSAEIINKNLLAYLLGKLNTINQPEVGITMAPKIEKIDGKLTWYEPAELIERKIRALNPWPGTYTTWQNQKLAIFEAELVNIKNEVSKVSKNPSGCIIGTSNGSIIPKKVQLPGKKVLEINEFLRGHQNFIGSFLG